MKSIPPIRSGEVAEWNVFMLHTLTLTPLYTIELGTQGVPCQFNGYTWKEVHTVLRKGDMIDLASVLASVLTACDVSKDNRAQMLSWMSVVEHKLAIWGIDWIYGAKWHN
ncbi:hypothetical protein AVEN_83657-1 [Araneus ventricosus]|uniref:Uncharacterized protein n=1 Tax=Araneus ventricosus TaxID=182803 RepID=A0A4Y2TX20_ARAVE|nr:hypothetical protein AVEN_83657-1 [Araneus ventricosus]